MEGNPSSSSSSFLRVRVAVRVRPLLPQPQPLHLNNMQQENDADDGGRLGAIQNKTAVNVRLRRREAVMVAESEEPVAKQILVDGRKRFTFDSVFGAASSQEEIYETCVRPLVQRFAESGESVTVLAYGQTGTGKTYTMGTHPDSKGIIPRAITDIFNLLSNTTSLSEEDRSTHEIEDPALITTTPSNITDTTTNSGDFQPKKSLLHSSTSLPPPPEQKLFEATATFLEIYNEDVLDLLSSTTTNNPSYPMSYTTTTLTPLTIQESSSNGNGIHVVGATRVPLSSAAAAERVWRMGIKARATKDMAVGAATAAAAGSGDVVGSSRSHAVFTVYLRRWVWVEAPGGVDGTGGRGGEWRVAVCKFNFVDLAGSERLQRTGAVGARQREGIFINSGLLALGNVISALATESTTHVPYRDSKLTRLLRDSLGGNSNTLMIACISPAESDLTETLSTLKYANRALRVKNKVSVTHERRAIDSNADAEVRRLRALVAEMKLEIAALKAGETPEDATTPTPATTLMLTNDNEQKHQSENRQLRRQMEEQREEMLRVKAHRDYLSNELAFLQAETTLKLGSSSTLASAADDSSGLESAATDSIGGESESVCSQVTTTTSLSASSRIPVLKKKRGVSMSMSPSVSVSGSVADSAVAGGSSATLSASSSLLPIATTSVDITEKQLRRLKFDLKEMTCAAQDYRKQVAVLEDRCNALQSATELMEAQIADFSAASKASAARCQLLDEKLKRAEEANEGAEEYIAGLESQLAIRDSLHEQMESLERDLKKAHSEEAERVALLANLEARLAATESGEHIKQIHQLELEVSRLNEIANTSISPSVCSHTHASTNTEADTQVDTNTESVVSMSQKLQDLERQVGYWKSLARTSSSQHEFGDSELTELNDTSDNNNSVSREVLQGSIAVKPVSPELQINDSFSLRSAAGANVQSISSASSEAQADDTSVLNETISVAVQTDESVIPFAMHDAIATPLNSSLSTSSVQTEAVTLPETSDAEVQYKADENNMAPSAFLSSININNISSLAETDEHVDERLRSAQDTIRELKESHRILNEQFLELEKYKDGMLSRELGHLMDVNTSCNTSSPPNTLQEAQERLKEAEAKLAIIFSDVEHEEKLQKQEETVDSIFKTDDNPKSFDSVKMSRSPSKSSTMGSLMSRLGWGSIGADETMKRHLMEAEEENLKLRDEILALKARLKIVKSDAIVARRNSVVSNISMTSLVSSSKRHSIMKDDEFLDGFNSPTLGSVDTYTLPIGEELKGNIDQGVQSFTMLEDPDKTQGRQTSALSQDDDEEYERCSPPLAPPLFRPSRMLLSTLTQTDQEYDVEISKLITSLKDERERNADLLLQLQKISKTSTSTENSAVVLSPSSKKVVELEKELTATRDRLKVLLAEMANMQISAAAPKSNSSRSLIDDDGNSFSPLTTASTRSVAEELVILKEENASLRERLGSGLVELRNRLIETASRHYTSEEMSDVRSRLEKILNDMESQKAVHRNEMAELEDQVRTLNAQLSLLEGQNLNMSQSLIDKEVSLKESLLRIHTLEIRAMEVEATNAVMIKELGVQLTSSKESLMQSESSATELAARLQAIQEHHETLMKRFEVEHEKEELRFKDLAAELNANKSRLNDLTLALESERAVNAELQMQLDELKISHASISLQLYEAEKAAKDHISLKGKAESEIVTLKAKIVELEQLSQHQSQQLLLSESALTSKALEYDRQSAELANSESAFSSLSTDCENMRLEAESLKLRVAKLDKTVAAQLQQLSAYESPVHTLQAKLNELDYARAEDETELAHRPEQVRHIETASRNAIQTSEPSKATTSVAGQQSRGATRAVPSVDSSPAAASPMGWFRFNGWSKSDLEHRTVLDDQPMTLSSETDIDRIEPQSRVKELENLLHNKERVVLELEAKLDESSKRLEILDAELLSCKQSTKKIISVDASVSTNLLPQLNAEYLQAHMEELTAQAAEAAEIASKVSEVEESYKRDKNVFEARIRELETEVAEWTVKYTNAEQSSLKESVLLNSRVVELQAKVKELESDLSSTTSSLHSHQIRQTPVQEKTSSGASSEQSVRALWNKLANSEDERAQQVEIIKRLEERLVEVFQQLSTCRDSLSRVPDLEARLKQAEAAHSNILSEHKKATFEIDSLRTQLIVARASKKKVELAFQQRDGVSPSEKVGLSQKLDDMKLSLKDLEEKLILSESLRSDQQKLIDSLQKSRTFEDGQRAALDTDLIHPPFIDLKTFSKASNSDLASTSIASSGENIAETVKSLNSLLEQRTTEAAALSKDVREHKMELERSRVEFSKIMESHSLELAATRREAIASATQELAESKTHIETLSHELSNLRTQLEATKTSQRSKNDASSMTDVGFAEIDAKVLDLQSQLRLKELEHMDMNNLLSLERSKMKSVEDQLNQLTIALQAELTSQDSSSSELESLRNELADAKNRIAKLELELMQSEALHPTTVSFMPKSSVNRSLDLPTSASSLNLLASNGNSSEISYLSALEQQQQQQTDVNTSHDLVTETFGPSQSLLVAHEELTSQLNTVMEERDKAIAEAQKLEDILSRIPSSSSHPYDLRVKEPHDSSSSSSSLAVSSMSSASSSPRQIVPLTHRLQESIYSLEQEKDDLYADLTSTSAILRMKEREIEELQATLTKLLASPSARGHTCAINGSTADKSVQCDVSSATTLYLSSSPSLEFHHADPMQIAPQNHENTLKDGRISQHVSSVGVQHEVGSALATLSVGVQHQEILREFSSIGVQYEEKLTSINTHPAAVRGKTPEGQVLQHELAQQDVIVSEREVLNSSDIAHTSPISRLSQLLDDQHQAGENTSMYSSMSSDQPNMIRSFSDFGKKSSTSLVCDVPRMSLHKNRTSYSHRPQIRTSGCAPDIERSLSQRVTKRDAKENQSRRFLMVSTKGEAVTGTLTGFEAEDKETSPASSFEGNYFLPSVFYNESVPPGINPSEVGTSSCGSSVLKVHPFLRVLSTQMKRVSSLSSREYVELLRRQLAEVEVSEGRGRRKIIELQEKVAQLEVAAATARNDALEAQRHNIESQNRILANRKKVGKMGGLFFKSSPH